jgi:hypothetical protein
MRKLGIWIRLLVVLAGVLYGQRELPREYVPAEELVSLNSDLEFSSALDILSEYAIRLSGKPLYDPTRQGGAIGVDITSLPWEKALQAVLSRRGLWYTQKEHFIQIAVPDEKISDQEKKLPDEIKFDLGSREIKIETIFFEGNRKKLAEMGVDWSTFYNGKVDVSGTQLASTTMTEDFFSATLAIPKSLVSVDVKALLKTLDQRNFGKVLAQPQVMVSEGNEGKIQVGEDFSIKTRDFAGNIIDRFFSTGTILQVTPYLIMDPQKGPVIFLKAHVERSQAYPDAVSTIIKKSEANSYVQLYDGEETIIAGLYSTEESSVRKGIPVLMHLPWWLLGIRYLVSYEHKELQEKELIIIIKASLLPEVFARKERPENIQRRSESAQDKSRRYLNDAFHNTDPGAKPTPVENTLVAAPGEKSVTETSTAQLVEQSPSSLAVQEPSAKKPSAFVTGYNQTSKAPELIAINPTIKKMAANSTNPSSSAAPFPEFTATSERGVKTVSNNIQKVFRGIIKHVQDDLVLIEWSKGFDPSGITENELTVFRRLIGQRDYRTVGQVRIVRSHDSKTVARANTETSIADIQPGDQVVVKL